MPRGVRVCAALVLLLTACGGSDPVGHGVCADREGDEVLVTSRYDGVKDGYGGDAGGSEIYLLHSDGTAGELLTGEDLVATDPSFSPDGTRIVFVSHVGDFESAGPVASSLTVLDLETREMARITGGPGWSEDVGDYTMTWDEARDAGIVPDWDQAASDGIVGPPGSVVVGVMATSPDWSPVADRIAFSLLDRDGSQRVYTVVPGEEPVLLADGPLGKRDLAPAWSADGTQVAFVRSTDPLGPDELWVVEADGDDPRMIAEIPSEDQARFFDLTWMPGGDQILIGSPGPRPLPLRLADLSSGAIETLTTSGSDFVWASERRVYGLTGDALVRIDIDDGRLGSVDQLGEIDHNVNERGLDVISCRSTQG